MTDITFEAKRTEGAMPEGFDPKGSAWKVRLESDGQSFTTDFYIGSALDAPTREDVLESLALDFAGVDQDQTFEEWADEYGMDADSRKAEALYRKVRAMHLRWCQTFGAALDDVLAEALES